MRALRRIAAVLLACALCAALPLQAQQSQQKKLIVLHDSGEAVPLEPYISWMLAGEDQDAVLEGLRFPIKTALAQAALPPEREGVQVFAPRWMTQNIFIIGTDGASIQWMETHRKALEGMHAMGLVIASASAAEFKAAQARAMPLLLAPAISPWMEQQLNTHGAAVYPLLVHIDGTATQNPGGKAP